MTQNGGPSRPYAIVLGIFLLIEGVWGMMSPVVFGFLTTNVLHASIHILLGIFGIATGLKGGSRAFCHFVGWLLLVVGAVYFVPVAGEFVTGLFNLNVYVAGFNIIVGIITLLVARASRTEDVVVAS